MDIMLNSIEARILGCMIEKQITTPDYYPLSLNALTNACNQKSNRNPVVSFDETVVVRGLDTLQDKGLSEKLYKADSRVPKYRHNFDKSLNLSRSEVAVLCELMLRGPQTQGELRSRGERMYKFKDIHEVEEVVSGLISRDRPMVTRLPRQAGRKESRYMHLLSGEPEVTGTEPAVPEESARQEVRAENERIARLEEDLSKLRKDFDTFMHEYKSFKSQFD
jgi:uncharacterized protein YceH (UPF0502 family)